MKQSPLVIELEQQELCERWKVKGVPLSMSTVRRMVKASGQEPIRFRGLVPIFSSVQADAMLVHWQNKLARSRRAVSRKLRHNHNARSNGNGHAPKILTVADVKRRAKR